MSDQDDWEIADPDDAKAEIRAAVGYLLRGATGGARGDIVQEIIAIVRQVASGLLPEQPDPLDDGLPGGCARGAWSFCVAIHLGGQKPGLKARLIANIS